MKPAIGSLWRRRSDLGPSPYLRFVRVRVIEDEDQLHAGDVLVECAGTLPGGRPGPGSGIFQAFEPAAFLSEYEPEQTELF